MIGQLLWALWLAVLADDTADDISDDEEDDDDDDQDSMEADLDKDEVLKPEPGRVQGDRLLLNHYTVTAEKKNRVSLLEWNFTVSCHCHYHYFNDLNYPLPLSSVQ